MNLPSIVETRFSFTNALTQAGISSISSAVAQSSINGDSFGDALKNSIKTSIIASMGQIGASGIGTAAHSGELAKAMGGSETLGAATQLVLHAGLGCAAGAASSGGTSGCAAGAAGGVIGEIVGTSLRPSIESGNIDKSSAIAAATIAGGITAAIAGNAAGGSDDKTAAGVWDGSRVGGNAAEWNATMVKVQPVKLGFYHTSVVHEVNPGDEKFFESDPRYIKDPETGKLYMTLGGGPDNVAQEIGKTNVHLIGTVNRERDILTDNKVYSSQNLISSDKDIYTASQLYWNNQAYQDNLPYEFFPTQNSQGYNSNSYTAGLLNSVGITPPMLPKYITYPTPWQDREYPEYSPKISYPVPMPTPGYDKPVPTQFFGVGKP